jgi:hypothetical protein
MFNRGAASPPYDGQDMVQDIDGDGVLGADLVQLDERAVARDYFERFPKDRYETSVEGWRHLQCDNYEFTMNRLREPKAP